MVGLLGHLILRKNLFYYGKTMYTKQSQTIVIVLLSDLRVAVF